MTQSKSSRPRIKLAALSVMFALLVGSNSGCSLFVMAGKMFLGDPKVPSNLRAKTGVNLSKKDRRVLVICSAPEAVKSELSGLEYDMTELIVRQLKRHKINVIDSDTVANWFDEHGGRLDDPSELARDFEVDYIIHVQVEEYDFLEENSRSMYRGRAVGSAIVYHVQDEQPIVARQIYAGDFRTQYPTLHPIPFEQISERSFQKQFLDYLTTQLSRQFYDYRRSESI